MKIYVAELGGRRDPHVVGYDGPVDECDLESVLYVSVPRRISRLELDSQLKALRSQWRRAAEAIVLRLHSPEVDELMADDHMVDALGRRFEGLPILLAHLGPDRAIRLTPLGESASTVGYDSRQLLDAVRFAELDSWLQQPGVVLPPSDDFHYEGPNGCRYESFMRVGTAIQGTEILDSVAFWLQPYLDGSPIVVLDSWTILSVGLNLDRYATQSGPPTLHVAGVECLKAYNEDKDELRVRLDGLAARLADPRPPALLVSSVVSSSALHGSLEELIGEAGFAPIESVALYGGESSPGTIFCRPENVARYWAPEDCPLESASVAIAPSTYLVEVAPDPKTVSIAYPNAEQAWDFFDRYSGVDSLSVHRDQHDGERHHLVHIDVDRLAAESEFLARLGTTLDSLPRIDVVLSPDHSAARGLARTASDRLGAELVVANEGELPKLPAEERQKLCEATRILLVDDVVITGSRIRGYRNFLRVGDFLSGECPPEIHILVGVARVDDNNQLRGIENMADLRRRFHAVERLMLPNWDETECPWCWELRRLEELGSDLVLTERLEARGEALRDSARGLRSSLFIPWPGSESEAGTQSTWTLGPGSIFHVRSEADLFAAVASAVQSLRAAGDLTERHQYPLARVLAFEHWLTGRYYDPVITAAILRATRRHDLRTAKIEPGLRRATARRLRENGSRGLRGEVMMAAARGHLPLGPDLAVDGELLNDPEADAGFVDLLHRVLQSPSYSTAS